MSSEPGEGTAASVRGADAAIISATNSVSADNNVHEEVESAVRMVWFSSRLAGSAGNRARGLQVLVRMGVVVPPAHGGEWRCRAVRALLE